MPTNTQKKIEKERRAVALSESVRIQLEQAAFSYIDQDDVTFKNSMIGLSKDAMQVQLDRMRSTMKFYKKIIEEPYYTEHPQKKETHRYQDAYRKAKSIHSKGKILKALIEG